MPSPDPVTRSEKRKLTGLASDLIEWAVENGRQFAWRSKSASVYEQIIVEVLLQRTTATAVENVFGSFTAIYPDWASLSAGGSDNLEQLLRPLGLWRRRARSLLGIAKYASSVGGTFPRDPREHRDIPAVGQYVSNAIMHFQHGQAAPLLDVNMARVIERFVRPRKLVDIRYDPWLQKAAHWLVRQYTREVNWAVLDFAALVCRARNPLCGSCPVSARCCYFKQHRN